MPPPDPDHWLYRFAPREWIRVALGELARAESALAQGDRRAGLAGCRRAAGMALNGMLCVTEPLPERYGRSYMEHLIALEADPGAPEPVRDAARLLVQAPLPGGALVALRTRTGDEQLVEAARTVMAHAYAAVVRVEPQEPAGAPAGDGGAGGDGEAS